jgi:hypothetical protein
LSLTLGAQRERRIDSAWSRHEVGKFSKSLGERLQGVDRKSGEIAAKPLLLSLLAPRYSQLSFTYTHVYISGSILESRARQKQLAKFRIWKFFLGGLDLPRSRQTFAQNRTSNLARGSQVAFRRAASADDWK